jgi:hypothetical protein
VRARRKEADDDGDGRRSPGADPPEVAYLAGAHIGRTDVADLDAAVLPDGPLYVHLGLDVTDPAGIPGLRYPASDGPDSTEVRRGIIVAEGDLVACQTWIDGTFTGPLTHSPVGELEPNGARVVWDLMNMFRFDDRGRLVEKFVRTDNRSLLRQLGTQVA